MTVLKHVASTTQPLADIKRYSRDFCFRQESVLEHVGFVGMYALALCRTFQNEEDFRDADALNVEKVLSRALIHDVDEAFTGDINRAAKYWSEKTLSSIEEMAWHGASVYVRPFANKKEWTDAKDDSAEGQIVRLADVASVVQKCRVEIGLLGNRSFIKVARECMMAIDPDRYTFKTLREEAEGLRTLLEGLK